MKTYAFWFCALSLWFCAVVWLHGCKSLTPAEQAQVARDNVHLSTCAAMAHLCKVATGDAGSYGACWDEWDRCLVSHGFVDGGAEGGK